MEKDQMKKDQKPEDKKETAKGQNLLLEVMGMDVEVRGEVEGVIR